MIELLAAASTVIAAGFSIIRWAIPSVNKIRGSLLKIDFICSEIQVNGGSSIKDAVNRLERSVNVIKYDLIKIDARQWALVSSLEQPTWESDPEGNWIKANTALLRLLGVTIDELKDNNWQVCTHFSDTKRVAEEFEWAIEAKRLFASTYKIVNAISGSIYEVDATCAPFFDNARSVIGWIGIFEEARLVEEKDLKISKNIRLTENSK